MGVQGTDMAQATLDDDELFGEAANELRSDIAASIETAEATLPDADEVWQPAGDNLLGELNTLRTALDTSDAREHLHEARKWLELGRRSGAIDGDDELVDRVKTLDSQLDAIDAAREAVGTLTSTLPSLRQLLESD